jgi:Flp pilus assembly secretin CpaC
MFFGAYDMKTDRRIFLQSIVLGVAAQWFGTITAARAQHDTLSLGVGASARMQFDRAFATVLVGDPAVVGVRSDDDISVLIEARHAGVTNLVFLDAQGLVTANIRVSVTPASNA